MNASFVASFNEELNVCVHEGDSHSDIASIGEHEFRMITELFDKTENVVL